MQDATSSVHGVCSRVVAKVKNLRQAIGSRVPKARCSLSATQALIFFCCVQGSCRGGARQLGPKPDG